MKLTELPIRPLHKKLTSNGTLCPGYMVNEYLLVLHPHEELWNKVMTIKQQFADKYQNNNASWVKPQISLVNFLQYQLMEDKLINRIKIIAMGHHTLKIELRDFGSFPSHTIYINVISKLPIQNLIKQIRTQAQHLMKLNNENKPHFILEPHLTIARKLLPWQYEQGWLEYSHKQFTGRFVATDMLLLKRPVGELKYTVVQKFAFENLPVSTKQGELFSLLSSKRGT